MSLMLALGYQTANIGFIKIGFLNNDSYINKHVIKFMLLFETALIYEFNNLYFLLVFVFNIVLSDTKHLCCSAAVC